MTAYVALIRASNVGGTGKLVMADLVTLCEEAGFAHAKTYIQSGNVVFDASGGEARVKAALGKALAAKLGTGRDFNTVTKLAAMAHALSVPARPRSTR